MKLRSQSWFGGINGFAFAHRAGMRAQGFSSDVFQNKPVIGICNSWSELNPCNSHLRLVAEAVKRGVWAAGGFPLEFPTISLGEVFVKPTTMLYRNMMAMDTEEMIRCHPVDAVVLLCGCDKTTPAQLMGAASADIPSIMVPGGPMLTGRFHGQEIGSGTDLIKSWNSVRVGQMTEEEFVEMESCMSRSVGHCMVMGTASTMTSIAEALGMTLPGSASIPAPDSRRLAIAQESGRRAVELVAEDLRPSKILTPEAFENAIRVDMAIGGSTNAIVHLLAIAGRLDIDLKLDDFDRISRTTPLLANVKPSGEYLMEDFFYAGGLPALMREMGDLLHTNALTVTGRTLRENIQEARIYNPDVICARRAPVRESGSTVILRGNLAPAGAVLKQSAASAHLLTHRGPAVVFRDRDEMLARIDDPALEVHANSVLVMQNCGPKGGPGMPEWGMIPIPQKLLEQGVTDMVRISDARMSGTAFGTVILHVVPESAVGGPLALVKTGDFIELNVPDRRLHLDVSQAELETRRACWFPPPPHYQRGYGRIFLDHVLQADRGCDFDVLLRGESDLDADGAARVAGHRPSLD